MLGDGNGQPGSPHFNQGRLILYVVGPIPLSTKEAWNTVMVPELWNKMQGSQ